MHNLQFWPKNVWQKNLSTLKNLTLSRPPNYFKFYRIDAKQILCSFENTFQIFWNGARDVQSKSVTTSSVAPASHRYNYLLVVRFETKTLKLFFTKSWQKISTRLYPGVCNFFGLRAVFEIFWALSATPYKHYELESNELTLNIVWLSVVEITWQALQEAGFDPRTAIFMFWLHL